MNGIEQNRLYHFETTKEKEMYFLFEGMTLQEIMDVTQTTRPTTYRKMMNMKEMGYVEKGCKSIQADTFYLLDKGINFIERKGEVEHD